jgi:hypothetical protein
VATDQDLPIAGVAARQRLMRPAGRPLRPGVGWWRTANYNTPIQTNASYPMIGLTGLLNLVTLVEKFRPQALEEKGSLCRPTSSPPAHRPQRAHPGVDAAARRESPTPPVAAQPAAGAPAERRRSAGGGQ